MDNQYDTGYGKPPEEHQFKPGESGNKKGRPKGTKNTYTLLNEILDQRISLKENGKPFKISKKGAILMHLVNKAVKGDTRSIISLFPHLLASDMKNEEREKIMNALNRDDREIINAYLSGIEKPGAEEEYGGDEDDEHREPAP